MARVYRAAMRRTLTDEEFDEMFESSRDADTCRHMDGRQP